jgi:hypothetical protein
MRILIVQTSYLGDTILSTPVIAAVRQLYPQAKLWMMTTPAATGLVARDPLLEGVIAFDKRHQAAGLTGLVRTGRYLRGMQFDRVYALQRSYRTALTLLASGIPHRTGFQNAKLSFIYHAKGIRTPSDHDVLRNLSLLMGEAPFPNSSTRLRLFPPPIEELGPAAKGILEQDKPLALLVPGSAWATKMWYWKHYRTVAGHFIDQGYTRRPAGGTGRPGGQPTGRPESANHRFGRGDIRCRSHGDRSKRAPHDLQRQHGASYGVRFSHPRAWLSSAPPALLLVSVPGRTQGPSLLKSKAWPVSPAPGMAATPAPPGRAPVWSHCCRKKFWRLQTRF